MTQEKHSQWSELNTMEVIEELSTNWSSKHWLTCSEFIRHIIEKKLSHLLLPSHRKDEAAQEALESAYKGLAGFRHKSKFTTWLTQIARNSTIDVWRKHIKIERWEGRLENTPGDHEDESGYLGSHPPPSSTKTPEEAILDKERKQETFLAIEAYIQNHANTARNRRILQLVLIEGYSQKQTAEALKIQAPIVGYIVRSAREYIKNYLKMQLGEEDK